MLVTTNGPRKSEILLRLGREYFGITEEEFQQDVQDNTDEEWNPYNPEPTIDPVWLDVKKGTYLKFYGKNSAIKRLYLDELEIKLQGEVLVYEENGIGTRCIKI